MEGRKKRWDKEQTAIKTAALTATIPIITLILNGLKAPMAETVSLD